MRGFAGWLVGVLALAGGLGGTVAASSVSGSSVAPLAGPVHPVGFTPENVVASGNWSGYATASFQTHHQYTSAQGSWIVPRATPPGPGQAGYSSAWVGIGGFCLDPACRRVDDSLIQLGTESDAARGPGNYYAWYEPLPGPPQLIPLGIAPGDQVTASVTLASGHDDHHGPGPGRPDRQLWTLSMTVQSGRRPAVQWSTTIPYQSSLASAEWISEAPYFNGILPLADTHTTSFDPGTVNGGANPQLVANQAVVMFDPNGQTSNPSAPDVDADGFNVCWGNGTTLSSCQPPAS